MVGRVNPRWWHLAGALCSTVFFVAILGRWFDPAVLGELLAPAHLPALGFACVFFAMMNVVRGVRVAHLGKGYLGVDVDAFSGIGLATVTNLANHVLPLRLGELVYVALSRSLLGIPLAQAAGVLLSIRVYDLLGLTLLVLLGLTQAPAMAEQISLPLLLALIAFLVAIASRLDLLFGLASRLFRGELARAVREALPFAKQPRFVATSIGYALVLWSVQAIGFGFLLQAFGIDVGAGSMVVATSVANLAAVLPLSVLGTFGAMEAGWTAGFVAMGVPGTLATTSGLAAHLVMVSASALMSLGFLGHLVSSRRQTLQTRKRAD